VWFSQAIPRQINTSLTYPTKPTFDYCESYHQIDQVMVAQIKPAQHQRESFGLLELVFIDCNCLYEVMDGEAMNQNEQVTKLSTLWGCQDTKSKISTVVIDLYNSIK
jgi:hypothetical protein